MRRNVSMTNTVAGISPLLQGRNGYLPSIGQKDRFLDGNVEKKSRNEVGQ